MDTKEQLEQIRELLVKMGETNLAAIGEGARGGTRVLLFSGDTKAGLENAPTDAPLGDTKLPPGYTTITTRVPSAAQPSGAGWRRLPC